MNELLTYSIFKDLMKLLITGGMGFIGSHLVEKLSGKNNKILVLTRTLSKRSNLSNVSKNITIKKVNLTNFQRVGKIIQDYKPDVIIHLAGNTSHSKSFENPLKDLDANTKSTLFLLEKIRQRNMKCKFILGSTFIVIGKPRKLPINEETECHPGTIYGVNRLTSEYYCKIFHDMYGLDTNIFRITNSFGPREQIIPNKNAVNFLIYQAFKKNDLNIFNSGKFFRDFIFIDDVISGIYTILRKGKSGETYWISSSEKIWFRDFAKILKEITDCKISYPQTPEYTKKVDVGNFVVDNTKLKKLGWKPKIELKVGIQKTMNYFKKEYSD